MGVPAELNGQSWFQSCKAKSPVRHVFSTTKPHPAEDQTQHSWKLPRSKRWEDHPVQILSYSELLANLWVASFHPYGQCSHSWQATSAPLLQPQANVFMPSVYPHIVKVCHKNTFKVGWTNTPTTSHQTCVRRPTVQMVAGCDWSHSTRHLGRWFSLVRKVAQQRPSEMVIQANIVILQTKHVYSTRKIF